MSSSIDQQYLPPDWIRRLLPFHLVVDRTGLIIQAGSLVERYVQRDSAFAPLLDIFEVERPAGIEAEVAGGAFDWLAQNSRRLWILRHRSESLRLKGSWEVHGDHAFFLANLWVTEMDELVDLGISIKYLPVHDHAVDHLLLLQQQQTSIRDMRTISRNLAEARDQAQAASRAKSAFLASMSHEIRTPMNGIMGLTEALYDTPISQRQRELLDTISQSAGRLMHIINDILDLSKVEAGELELRPEAMDVRAEIAHVLRMYATTAQEKQISVAAVYSDDVPSWIEADPVRFSQVLTNLMGNALKFTPSGGSVEISVDYDGRDMQITVRDTGVGISEDDLEAIFLPFKQTDEGLKKGSAGTGLGLAICRRIVELMHGSLTASSKLGAGSAFVVRFQPVLSAEPDRPRTSGGQVSFNGSCLVVDDNPVNLQVAQHMLQRAGLAVETAADGAQAVRRFADTTAGFDLVFMDCHMPVMDGFEAARAIRTKGVTVPIIALTADVMEEAADECLNAGMNAVVTKPIRYSDLTKTLLQFLPSN